jgi:hypothetical protein
MNIKPLVALSLLLSCGSALAGEQSIHSIEVRPQARATLDFACANPQAASPAEVERILQVNDRSQTNELGHKLLGAVGEACNAGVAYITVTRAASGHSVTWAPARAIDASVALN